jgi:cytoskeletal protein CcmA (bactofilin family)
MAQWPISAFRVTPPAIAPANSVTPMPRLGSDEERTLFVGLGISVLGNVLDAERLVVEGVVEANMLQANQLSILSGGVFKGGVEVDEAEVAGTIDGTLTVWNSLIIRNTGSVLGIVRCRQLEVEEGGKINGQMNMITERHRPEVVPRQPGEPI